MVEQVKVPDIEELLHLIAEPQRVVSFDQTGKNEQNANKPSGNSQDLLHMSTV